jgi:small subunit ribosomal protein S4
MGKPKFSRKKYETPKHPWQEGRIKEEDELIKKYELKNKKEIWKAKTQLRRYRSQARELLASVRTGDEQSKKESDQLLNSLSRMSILPTKSTLDDVLALETESILSRRLQTITYLKGFASTPNQARQLITHGHIKVGERRVTIPSYMLTKNEENTISYTEASPLNDSMHPARPKSDFRGETRKKAKPEEQKEEKQEKDEKKEEKTEESKETKEEVKQEESEKPKEEKTPKEEEKKEETKKEEQDVKTEEPK